MLRKIKVGPEEVETHGKWLLWDHDKIGARLVKLGDQSYFCLFSDLLKLREYAAAINVPPAFYQIDDEAELTIQYIVDINRLIFANAQAMFDPYVDARGNTVYYHLSSSGDPMGHRESNSE